MDRTFLALVQDFIDETLPLAEAIADASLELGTRWSKGEHPTQLFQRIKSNLHTLKGNSAMMGLQPIQALAHALEDVCARASEDGAWRARTTSQVLSDGAEVLGSMVRSAARGEVEAKASKPMMERVAAFLKGAAPIDELGNTESKRISLSELVTPPPVAAPLPPKSGAKPPKPQAVEAPPQPPRSAGSSGIVTVSQVASASMGPAGPPTSSQVTNVPPPLVSAQPVDDRSPAAGEGAAESIRVDFHRLDDMLELIGEALITHSHIATTTRGLIAADTTRPELSQLDQGVVLLTKTLKQLKETLLATRLVPMATLFNRFIRYVSRLSRERNQPITCLTSGGDTPIDKTIIDRLGEPLLHIIRNAVAHGIEAVDERVAAGKPEEATLTLSASYASERVLISVSDDGRGIDVGAVLAKARSLGFETEGLGHDDALRLIFTPGFSTAKEVSSLSGRGVGLDAVAQSVQALGGSVDVQSEPGVGTTFVLNLPLTLAVMQGLVIEVDHEKFAIPMGAVIESVRVTEGEIHEMAQVGVLPWRGGLMPVIDAGKLLGTKGAKAERTYCIVVSSGSKRRGILVDKLVGLQEIVVKALDDACGRPDVVSGATILGDGRVVLILDSAGIVHERYHGALRPTQVS